MTARGTQRWPSACGIVLLLLVACDESSEDAQGAPPGSDAAAMRGTDAGAGAAMHVSMRPHDAGSKPACTGACDAGPEHGRKDAAVAADPKDAATDDPLFLDAHFQNAPCGDGDLNPNREECDDGNNVSGDGCDATCRVEQDYYCMYPGMPCVRPGDPDCSVSACREQGVCVEPSGSSCRCPPQTTAQAACSDLRLRSLELPEGAVTSHATSISRDGKTVVGYVAGVNTNFSAAAWTLAHGLTLAPPIDDSSQAVASADDGGVVLVTTGNSVYDSHAYLWKGSEPELEPFAQHGAATDVSADGSVIVGSLGAGSVDDPPVAFRWTVGSGFDTFVSVPASDCMEDEDAGAPRCPVWMSHAAAVSADGNTILSAEYWQSRARFSWNDVTWFLWSAASGAQTLLPDPGLDDALHDLSDTSIAVGEHWVRHANGRWAIRRTSTEIETLSPSSPSDADEYAFAVNADGSVIVGQSGQRPMIWIEGEPPRALADVLADDGVDVSDWTFEMATGVSADGKLIVGNGICQGREVGFVARLR